MIEIRGMRWVLFAALMWTWPLPFLGFDDTFIPVARFIQLAGSLSILIGLEGTGGVVGPLFVLLWGHVFVYSGILFGATSILMVQLRSRLSERMGTSVALAVVFALISWASFADPYSTPFHHSNAHAPLLDLYH